MRRSSVRGVAFASAVALALASCSLVLPFDSYTSGNDDAAPADQDGSASSSGDAAPVVDASHDGAPPCDDVRSSSAHCGACNHDCLGDRCEDGRCVATPVATTAAGGFGIDVDAQNVYWSVSYGDGIGGQVLRVDKNATGAVGTVLIDSPQPRFDPVDVRVDGSYVVVADRSPGSGTSALYRVPAAGGGVAGLAACAVDGVSGLAVGSSEFYFASSRTDNTSVYHAAKSGATCAPAVAEGWNGLAQIALDDGILYLTQPNVASSPAGSLFAVPVGSDTPVAIASDTVVGAWGVHVDGDSILVSTEEGAVLRVAKDGSSTTSLSSEVEGLPRGLAADATHVYWANAVAGEIVSYDRETKARRVLASGQTGVQLLASDATRLYWLTSTHVMRLAK